MRGKRGKRIMNLDKIYNIMMTVAGFFIIIGLGLSIAALIAGSQIYAEISIFILAVVVAVFWIGERISISVAEREDRNK